MDFHQLKSFYYVANYLNFSKAAEKVALSQPAVSRQIEALEAHYQLSLFKRTGRKVELTDAGRRLLQYAEKILLLTEETEKAMNALNNLEAGEIKVGAGTTIGNYLLPSLIVDFQQKYATIAIDLSIDKTEVIIEKLKKGELDVAIAAKSSKDPDFNYKALLNEEVLLIAGKTGKWNLEEITTIHQLKDETFFLRKAGSNTREKIDTFFQTHQFKPKKQIEFDTNEAIKQAIIKHQGIGFLSEQVIANERKLGLVEPFKLAERCQRNFSLIFPKEKFATPALLIFNQFIKKNIYKR
ncbi:LysR family transcriptional regulator [Neobacillus sp. SM06]|uniref:LysR family transcriptional regulator n=1 Tax=Neobacillus sp. SM06 TaxID=3422492 RepID=UPI003D288490